MADDFTAIRVKQTTQIKLKLLAAAYQQDMYDIADRLLDAEWREAVKVGLVTDAQLKNILARAAAETQA